MPDEIYDELKKKYLLSNFKKKSKSKSSTPTNTNPTL